jgi:ferritin-like metal-binding protein YciE
MDASPDVLAETVRAKRVAIDNDLELLRIRLQSADPRRHLDVRQIAIKALPFAAGTAALLLWRSRRRRIEQTLGQHYEETEAQIERLQRVFRSIGARPKRGSSSAVEAIVDDGERLLAGRSDRDVRDAWIIAVAQRLEHLEIANYGTARTHAETLGFVYAAQLLQQTLEEERAADEKLTTLAERFVNLQSLRTSGAH